jgi:hypothetical protein
MITERDLRNSVAVCGVAVGLVLAAGTRTSAHRLDELLQAARIGIAEDRVHFELDLTPGAAVADAITSDIDWDHDGAFSTAEQRAYVDRIFNELSLRAGDVQLRLTLTTFTFPSAEAFRTGDGVIAIRAAAPIAAPSPGAYRMFFDNRFRPDDSVYLANAMVPDSNRIAVTAQLRDERQSALTITYDVRRAEPRAAMLGVLLVSTAALSAVVVNRRRRFAITERA